MKISVLLSLFIKENPVYFDRSLTSIWDDQTRKPDEIVLVKDGPLTVELESIIIKWKEKLGEKFVVVSLRENRGLAIALNEGVKHCAGEYIARMDTDDISMPDRFFLQEKYLEIHPEVALLGGGMYEMNENEEIIAERKMPISYDDIKRAFPKTNPFVHPAVIINRKVFDSGLFYNERCRRNQDIEFWFRIVAAGFEVANISDLILKFRKTPMMYTKRRKSANLEFKLFINGIYSLYGLFSWRYIYPILHYLFRFLPAKFSLWIYSKIVVKYWK